jgi:hypothetical protein
MPPMGMAPPPGFMPRPPMYPPMPPRGPVPAAAPVSISAPPATPLAEPVSVYIGKIPSDIDDSFMMKLLLACGHVTKWRRTTDSETGLLKAFGFCDYSSLDAVRRVRAVICVFFPVSVHHADAPPPLCAGLAACRR